MQAALVAQTVTVLDVNVSGEYHKAGLLCVILTPKPSKITSKDTQNVL